MSLGVELWHRNNGAARGAALEPISSLGTALRGTVLKLATVVALLGLFPSDVGAASEISVGISAGPASGLASGFTSDIQAKHLLLDVRSIGSRWFFGLGMADFRQTQRPPRFTPLTSDYYSIAATFGVTKSLRRVRLSVGIGPTIWTGVQSGGGLQGVIEADLRLSSLLGVFAAGHAEKDYLADNNGDVRSIVGGLRLVFSK